MPVSNGVNCAIVEIATGDMVLHRDILVLTSVLVIRHRNVEDGTRIMCMRHENDVCISLNSHY